MSSSPPGASHAVPEVIATKRFEGQAWMVRFGATSEPSYEEDMCSACFEAGTLHYGLAGLANYRCIEGNSNLACDFPLAERKDRVM